MRDDPRASRGRRSAERTRGYLGATVSDAAAAGTSRRRVGGHLRGRRPRRAAMRERRQRGRREHDQHHRAERESVDLAAVVRGEEQQHGDEPARRDPHEPLHVGLAQTLEDHPARREDQRDAGGRDQPRLDRQHRAHVGPVAEQQEEEALRRERELGDQALELLQRLRVVVVVQRAQLRVEVDEVRVVDHEAADEDDDQRRQVQHLADRVEEDQAREQRQEADVTDDLADEVVERDRGGDRREQRQRAAAEEVEREVRQRAVRAQPRIEDEDAEDVGQRRLVDDELARLRGKPGGAREWRPRC